jgi:hypothetical protein
MEQKSIPSKFAIRFSTFSVKIIISVIIKYLKFVFSGSQKTQVC